MGKVWKGERKRGKLRAKGWGQRAKSYEWGGEERHQLERDEDRSRWRGGCWEPALCPMPCSLALYTAHTHPRGAGMEGRQGAGEPGKEGTTPMAQGTEGHRTHRERQGTRH